MQDFFLCIVCDSQTQSQTVTTVKHWNLWTKVNKVTRTGILSTVNSELQWMFHALALCQRSFAADQPMELLSQFFFLYHIHVTVHNSTSNCTTIMWFSVYIQSCAYSIYASLQAFSKVVQKLVPELPTLENLLNIFIAVSSPHWTYMC